MWRSRASLSVSDVARLSRDHLPTDSVRVNISFLSATLGPVARLASSPVLTGVGLAGWEKGYLGMFFT